uniref:Treble clef zinc finger domain-containing protein n=1 Tax=viral metagenome TaxID=1070528 RepID=A0A6C0AG34_9ZZZZ
MDNSFANLTISSVSVNNIPEEIITSNLLKDKRPDIFIQIHPTKNVCLNIDKLTCGSSKIIWWLCPINPCGCHEYQTSIKRILIKKNSLCPYCTIHQPIPCEHSNSIFSDEIWIKEFAYDLNIGLDPKKIAKGSNDKIWWRCTKHNTCEMHIWEAAPNSRNGCPWCTNKKVCKCNSMMTVEGIPELFCQELNSDIDPYAISISSHKQLTWKCLDHKTCKEHIWEGYVSNVVGKGSRCPWCKGGSSKTCKCMSFMNIPKLFEEFDQTLNPDLDPWKISKGNNIDIWWRCSEHKTCNKHIWKGRVSRRTGPQSCGCPFCNGSHQKCDCISFMQNELLAKEFIQELNPDIDPWKISYGSDKVINWKCIDCSTIWKDNIYHRNSPSDPRTCPNCNNMRSESKGANLCRQYLDNNNINYQCETALDNYITNRRFDFKFIYNNRNFILEYDGEQHFNQCTWHKDEEDFLSKQEIDRIKNYFAILSGYIVIRISKKEYNSIVKYLDYFINYNFEEPLVCIDDTVKYEYIMLKNQLQNYSEDIEIKYLSM